MPKQNIYMVLDTETTINSHIADIAFVVVDSQGRELDRFACLIAEFYQNEELFYDKNSALSVWTLSGLKRRRENYEMMLENGDRVLSSVGAINRWIEGIKQKYAKKNLMITAYNYAFDLDKCKRSGVSLLDIPSFCLWQAALGNITHTKKYRRFVLDNHLFNPTTKAGNATYSTNAQNVAWFCKGYFEEEQHDALGDVLDFEIAILLKVIKAKKWREKTTKYSWHRHQLRDHYTVK